MLVHDDPFSSALLPDGGMASDQVHGRAVLLYAQSHSLGPTNRRLLWLPFDVPPRLLLRMPLGAREPPGLSMA